MKSINNLFVKTFKSMLFDDNSYRATLLQNLLNNNISPIVSMWNKIVKLNNLDTSFFVTNNDFSVIKESLFDDFKIIHIYLPFATNLNDYILISFINNAPERMCFCGIELISEPIVENFIKKDHLIPCFSCWIDNKNHIRPSIISNEFKLFDIYDKLFLERLIELDDLYIPIKRDYENISDFFINSELNDISSAVSQSTSLLNVEQTQELLSFSFDIPLQIKYIFILCMQIAIKKGNTIIDASLLLQMAQYIKDNANWIKQNKLMFYKEYIPFINFYCNSSSEVKDFYYNILYILLFNLPSSFIFIDLENKTCCLS